MGKDWLYWVGGGGGGRKSREMKKAAATSAGCMCAVFQIFDLHNFQIPLNQQNPLTSSDCDGFCHQEEAIITSKGLEAPRNSLEMEEPPAIKFAAIPLSMKVEENLNFPMGIHIKTSHEKISSPRISTTSTSKSRIDDISSEYSSSSPGTKTPTLVARLMGLDLLPEESTSPSFSSSDSKPPKKSHLHQNYQRKDRIILDKRSKRTFFDDDISVGARSLPDTPRVSSERRSDVEYHHHRLSLQVNKENVSEEFGVLRRRNRGRFSQLSQDGSRSPGHYAKQIVKQVKESVSKRMGLTDITNTSTNKSKFEYSRRDENLILLKPTRKKSRFDGEISPDGTPSCSPRLRFLETNKNKLSVVVTNSDTKSPRISVQSTDNSSKFKSQESVPLQEQQEHIKDKFESGKCSSSGFKIKVSNDGIKKKKEETFVRSKAANKANLVEKKSKKTPLMSSEILNISGPILLPVKKDPSPPATKLPQKQVSSDAALPSKSSRQLSSNPNHSYKHHQPDKIITISTPKPHPVNSKKTTTTLHIAELENYVQRILKRTGITLSNIATWHKLSHPLDPTVFHYLELFQPNTTSNSFLSHRCNRKLIFQLVDEILGEILRPNFSWVSRFTRDISLVDEVCKKILDFPARNCEVLEDIDSLIDTDLCESHRSNGYFFEEEMESVVREIEREIVGKLLNETVAIVVSVRRRISDRG